MSLPDLIGRKRGNPTEIASKILDEVGDEAWKHLDPDLQQAALGYAVRRYFRELRSGSVTTVLDDGEPWNPHPRCRVATAPPGYWSAPWLIDGRYKLTRELTTADCAWKRDEYSEQVARLEAYQNLFDSWIAFAGEHGVETLGELEKQGIDLPLAEVVKA